MHHHQEEAGITTFKNGNKSYNIFFNVISFNREKIYIYIYINFTINDDVLKLNKKWKKISSSSFLSYLQKFLIFLLFIYAYEKKILFLFSFNQFFYIYISKNKRVKNKQTSLENGKECMYKIKQATL